MKTLDCNFATANKLTHDFHMLSKPSQIYEINMIAKH